MSEGEKERDEEEGEEDDGDIDEERKENAELGLITTD